MAQRQAVRLLSIVGNQGMTVHTCTSYDILCVQTFVWDLPDNFFPCHLATKEIKLERAFWKCFGHLDVDIQQDGSLL